MGSYVTLGSVALNQLINGSIWIIDKSNVKKVKRYFLFGLITVPSTRRYPCKSRLSLRPLLTIISGTLLTFIFFIRESFGLRFM